VLAFSCEVLGFIAHAKMVDCLFRSQLLDAVVDIMPESVSICSFKKDKHLINLVLLLLDVTKLVFEWI